MWKDNNTEKEDTKILNQYDEEIINTRVFVSKILRETRRTSNPANSNLERKSCEVEAENCYV